MIRWRLHLASPPAAVFDLLATDAGRARFALKAAADFGVDLRNHEAARSWDEGFVDN